MKSGYTKVSRYDIRKGVTRHLYLSSLFIKTAGVISISVLLLSTFMVSRVTNQAEGSMKATGSHMFFTSKKSQSASQTSSTPPAPQSSVPANVKTAAQAANLTTPVVPSWTRLPLYNDPANDAAAYARNNPLADGAALIGRQGSVPIATWFGDWNADPASAVDAYVTAAAKAAAVPVVVLYNIPERDCGSYSAGGASSSAAYINWVQAAARGIGGRSTVVVLEPDALASLNCLSIADQNSRYGMLAQAVSILKASPNSFVYIDAGNPAWQPADIMADRLRKVNIDQADGFSLNVANYVPTLRNQSYGDQLSKLTGGKHYIIDTSRNGNGSISPDQWCNNFAAALGSSPTLNTGNPRNDALLWIKVPWESDGTCNGGPTAGMAYWRFAVQLAKNAGW